MRRGTYSIVARDPGTGELGVAVQSHWFSVGSIVTWAEPGVGAVATQSIAEPAYGPRALERLRGGEGAPEALAGLVAADAEAAVRQVAVVDARGGVACHTGAGCILFAGDAGGAGYSCQANMMASAGVWPAMADAYEAAEPGTALAERLVAALEAGERAGGDVRGRQSAALLVVPAEGEAWDRTELRVEDHPEPLDELGRLLRLHRAYEVASEADELAGQGRLDEAGPLYERSSELAPESDELLFWAGLAAAQAGDLAAGVEKVRRATALNAGWAELLPRLPAELAPGAEAVRRALEGAG